MSRPILPESAYAALGLDSETIKILTTPKPPDEPPEFAAPNLLQSDEDNAQPMEPNETLITMYAELLLHVRTISLFASLRTHHSHETTAKLNSNGTCITVTHEGRTASINMPFEVKGSGNAEMTLPSEPHSKDITLRMQLEELEDSDVLGTLQSEERKVNVVPWDGATLDKQSDLVVRCKSCQSVLVPQDKITQWRDLPNENWAEMMDFWHCHKPDEHHLHDHTHEAAMQSKGYAANTRLKAIQGLGFVDLISFLLAPQDCNGAQAITEESVSEGFVVCKHCQNTLGTPDDSSDGWRVWKWNVDIETEEFSRATHSMYNTQKWITARLLYLIENTGIRKFHIHPVSPTSSIPNGTAASQDDGDGPLSTPSLLVWVFTPDLLFSSSVPSPGRHDPTRAMKVFYQPQTWQPLKPGEPESASIEDVEFPEELFRELDDVLARSQSLLPPTARKFQGWQVGLLERFDLRDVAPGSVPEHPGGGEKAEEDKSEDHADDESGNGADNESEERPDSEAEDRAKNKSDARTNIDGDERGRPRER